MLSSDSYRVFRNMILGDDDCRDVMLSEFDCRYIIELSGSSSSTAHCFYVDTL